MARDDYRQYAPQARPARGLAFFALVLFALAALAHRFGSVPTPEFLWVLGIVAALALIALVFAIFALRRIWIEDDAGTGAAIVGLLLASIVLAPFAVGLQGFFANPRLTDISTDRTMPPAFAAANEGRDGRMNPIVAISPADAEAMAAAYPELVSRSYALPLADVTPGVLVPVPGAQSFCEFKGRAGYYDVVGTDADGRRVVRPRGAWGYPHPARGYEALADHVALYPAGLVCTVDGEPVQAQEGDFYGGWRTSRVVGPFKGGAGTRGW